MDSRPVWLVTLAGDKKVVLKAENASGLRSLTGGKSYEFQGALMTQATGTGIESEQLSRDEIDALKAAPEQKFQGRNSGGECGKQATAITAKDAKNYLDLYFTNPQCFWVKMSFISNLKALDWMTEDDDKGKAKKLKDKIEKDPTMLLRLGQILAADLFNGNEDRVSLSGPRMGSIVNAGNLIFQKDPSTKKYTPIGLDWHEADHDKSDLYSNDLSNWPGIMLKDDKKLKTLADAFLNSLNEALAKRNQKPLTVSPSSLEKGLIGGRDSIKHYLMGLQRAGKGMPKGVLARVDALGWAVKSSPWKKAQPSGRIGSHRSNSH